MRGFAKIIPSDHIQLFSASELKLLINGDRRPFDMDDMKRHTKYQSGYHPSQQYVQDFWDVVEAMCPDDQAAFLKFCTSASRQPLLGFGHLEPPLGIQQVNAQEFPGQAPRLPSARYPNISLPNITDQYYQPRANSVVS
jgi:hypothetical protein